MKIKMITVAVLASTLLAACGAPATPPIISTQPPGTPTQPPSVLPTMPPSVLPTMPPSVLPTAESGGVTPGGALMTRQQAEMWNNAPPAALAARGDLVKRISVDPDLIQLISAEHVEWPNGCLGIETPGLMCTMIITPGFKVVLEANGKQYEYHTNEDGSAVRLVGG